MNDFELLNSVIKSRKLDGSNRRRNNALKEVDDIAFFMHWYPAYKVEDIWRMPIKNFNLLLRAAKRDYYRENLQLVVGFGAMNAGKDAAKKYIKNIEEEIRRLETTL